MTTYMQGNMTFEERAALFNDFIHKLDQQHESYTLTAEALGGCWVRTLNCPKLGLKLELASHHPVINPSLNGSFKAWYKDGTYWLINESKDLKTEGRPQLRGNIFD